MAGATRAQPYNVIMAGSFGVGKSSLFSRLSGEVHSDYQFSPLQDCSYSYSLQTGHYDKWTHRALVNGEQVKVMRSAGVTTN